MASAAEADPRLKGVASLLDSTSAEAGGILRFPNPGSELERVVNHFRVIYRAAQLRKMPRASFDHFFAIEALVRDNRVSSKGAIGEKALVRGAEADLSRHRTYNQLKMYTELYRMLGLLRTTSRRSEFVVTPLGEQLCDSGCDDFAGWDPKSPLDSKERGLIRECLIGICIPNPTTRQLGIDHLRPFRQLLRLMSRLDGVMARDEMLISLYKIRDDRDDTAIEAAAERVRAVRGDRAALGRAFDATRGGLGAETVRNYTRFPLGVLKSRSSAGRSRRGEPASTDLSRFMCTSSPGLDALLLRLSRGSLTFEKPTSKACHSRRARGLRTARSTRL